MKPGHPEHFHDEYLRLWVAEDGSKSLRIERAAAGELRATVWQGLGGRVLALDRLAVWHPREASAAASDAALRRLDRLSLELGETGLGTTYELMFATENLDASAYGGFLWRPVDPAAEVQAVRLFPQSGASYYEAVLGYWDDFVEALRQADSWVEPLSTYRPATDEETRRHAEALDPARVEERREISEN